MDSDIWMERVAERAVELSAAKAQCEAGEISEREYTLVLGRYRHAVRKYTNPFKVNKYVQ